jgi:hypothetical protein
MRLIVIIKRTMLGIASTESCFSSRFVHTPLVTASQTVSMSTTKGWRFGAPHGEV